MKKYLPLLTWFSLLVCTISIFFTQIAFQQSKVFLIISFFVLIILFAIQVIKEKKSFREYLRAVLLFIFLAIISFYSGVLFYVLNEKVCQSNKPVEYKVWNNIEKIDIARTFNEIIKFKDRFDISVISKIAYASDTFNIYSININPEQKYKFLILTGIHGSEPAGVASIPLIVNDIVSNTKKYKDFNIQIVFPLNPVGLAEFSRVNECGCDINRDFKLFKSTQAILIKQLFQNNKYDVVLDLHEGPYMGHAILTNSIIDNNLIKHLNAYLRKNNISQSSFNSGNGSSFKTFLQFYKYNNFLSKFGESKMIFSFANDCGTMYITSESDGFSKDYNMRVKTHFLMFKGIINYFDKTDD